LPRIRSSNAPVRIARGRPGLTGLLLAPALRRATRRRTRRCRDRRTTLLPAPPQGSTSGKAETYTAALCLNGHPGKSWLGPQLLEQSDLQRQGTCIFGHELHFAPGLRNETLALHAT